MGSGGLETAADRGREGGGSEGGSGYIGFPRLPFIRARTSPYIQERRSRRRVKDRLPFVALCREQPRGVGFSSRPWSVLARFRPPSAAVRKSYAACATHSRHIAGPSSTYRMSPRAGVTLHWSGGLRSREEANPGGISRGPHQRSLTLWERALTWPWCFALIVAGCCQPPAHVLLSSLRFGAR